MIVTCEKSSFLDRRLEVLMNNEITIAILDELSKEITAKKHLEPKYLESRGNANGFEELMKEVIIGEFNSTINHVIPNKNIKLIPRFGHHFPDLDLRINEKTYGIELKSRNNGSWTTLGGSVIESISKDNYEEIYLLFASFDKKKGETSYKVQYKPYWEAADAIKVTHSPRFNLNLNSSKSVFNSNDEYRALRNMTNENKLQFIRRTLANNATSATWYTNPDKSLPPTIFSTLNKAQKDKLKVEVMFLYPEDLLHQPRARYDRITNYLLSQYFIVNTATRDMFTAGGTINIKGITFPKIVGRYRENKEAILNLLNTKDNDFIDMAYDLWGFDQNSRTTIKADFFHVIDLCGNRYLNDNLNKISVTKLSHLLFQ